MKIAAVIMMLGMAAGSLNASTVDRVFVRQLWPWSTDIYVEYELGDVSGSTDLLVEVYDGNTKIDQSVVDAAISGERYAITTSRTGRLYIDPVAVFGSDRAEVPDLRVKVSAVDSRENINEVLYRIYSLTNAAVTEVTRAELLNGKYGSIVTDYSSFGAGFESNLADVLVWTAVTNDVKYKTTHLVMRKIPAGSFTMGGDNNTPSVDLAVNADFFMGVFEMTQKQCEFLATRAVAYFSNTTYAATRPMEKVTFKDLRGSNGRYWPDPAYNESTPASGTYVKELRDITGNNSFDLPQEMYWEYAARAGAQTIWNNGENDSQNGDRNTVMPKLGRSKYTGGWTADATAAADVRGDVSSENGTAEVGSYAPNAWGLYDIHGNVAEWCIDRYGEWKDLTVDILQNGTTGFSADNHVVRGGSWDQGPANQHLDQRVKMAQGNGGNHTGWRAFCR